MADLTNEERIAQQLQVGNASLAILGFKFNDLNADGIRQLPGEGGLADIPILLEPAIGSDGIQNRPGEISKNTGLGGAFSFSDILPGTYRLTETIIPPGFRATTPNPLFVTVLDKNVNNVLFGNTGTPDSRIVGCKYLDLDNDGFRDGDEPGIKNVRIYLDLNGNGQFDRGTDRETFTGKNGAWSFDVAPGTYKVREERLIPPVSPSVLRTQDTSVPPTAEPLERDFPQSTPPDNVPALDVTVRAGETFACAQVGNTPLYQIEVIKFEDRDRNGSRNVVGASNVLEPLIPNVPFILDLNKNGRWDEGSEPIELTDLNGKVTFRNLFADNYSVLEIFTSVLPDGGIPGNLRLPVPTTPNPAVVSAPGPNAKLQGTISREQPLLVQDLSYRLRGNDPRFVDSNLDGVQQVGIERSIAATGERPIFANTPVAVREPNPPLLRFSPVRPNSGNDINSPVGNTRPSITVFKYNDLNGNRRFEPEQGEAGLDGVRVFLDLNNNGQLDTGERTAVTRTLVGNERPDLVEPRSRLGRALFDDLAPGITYTVREVVPDGFSPSTADNVSVALNTQDAEVTFANTPNSKITGCKFEDFNQNGYRDGNEPAIAGVTIFIDTNRDGQFQTGEPTRITDRFGTFEFGGLRPGNYSIEEVIPPGSSKTTQSLDISLGPNQVFTCALIGNVRLYDLKVPKFNDRNRNGVRETNEEFLPNIPFVLDKNKNGRFDRGVDSEVVRTDANGIALFKNLLPGTYSVLEVFNTPGVTNPFPIATGPNPVNFDVPDPNNQYTVPSPPRPPEIAMMSIDLVTGDTGVAAASIDPDPLTNGGSSAVVQASSVDSLLAPTPEGVSSFIDFNALKDAAEASILTFLEAQKLDEPKLMLGAPTSTPLF